jgi:hypothetical protein
MIGYQEKLARVLDAMGGLYHVGDLLDRIGDGRMQSFAVGNSWAITEVQTFPRARKVHVVALVGDVGDTTALNDKVLEFARNEGVGLVSTFGRRGYSAHGHELGWRLKSRGFLWQKEL